MPSKIDKTEQEQQLLDLEREENLSYQYTLSEDEKLRVVKQIQQEIEFEEASRAEFMEIRKESMKLYEGIREPKSDPWENCSNITTMLTAAHCKLMHAMLLPSVWNKNYLYWRPVEKADIDNVDSVKIFMDWATEHDVDMQDISDDGVLQGVTDGTIIFKVRWVKDFRWIGERVFKGHRMFGGRKETINYRYKKFERCQVDLIELEDYLQSGPDEQKCSYVIQSMYNTLNDLKDMEKRGFFIGGSITEALEPKLTEIISGGSREIKESAEGFARIEALKHSRPIRIVERYGKWQINGQMVESVFTIAHETGTYLSGKPLASVNRIGKRPFVMGPLIRRVGRVYGQSIPELLRNLQKEIDAIHNQRIDAGTISIAPFGVYRAASSVKPEVIKIGPGVLIPVDDVKDIQLMQFPANFAFSYQEERLIVEYIEKLTVMSSYSFGKESDVVKSRATATSTLALLSQGQQALTLLGVRLQNIFSRLLTMILQYYQMYMPPGMADRVLGQDAQGKFKLLFDPTLTPETIAGGYDAYMELDVSGGNKAIEQQTATLIMQSAPQLLTLAQDPRGWEIVANFLKKVGEHNIERFIGPKPGEDQEEQGMDMEQIRGLLGQTDESPEEPTETLEEPVETQEPEENVNGQV